MVILGRDLARAQRKAVELSTGAVGKISGLAAPSNDPDAFARVFGEIERRFGRLHGLAITAGDMQRQDEFLNLADEDWAASFEALVMPVVRASRAALPLLIANRGRLVTTAAYSTRAQKPTLASYAAMKSAVVSLTKNIAKTYGSTGLRANCVAPGAIDTDAFEPLRVAALGLYGPPVDEALNKLMIDKWGMKVALNRVGRPREVGELIAFLLSDRAAYMTGATINIDGGTDF